MRKKECLARVLGLTGLYGPCRFLRQRLIKELPILAYHRVYDIEDITAFPFDPELINASCASFAWQMHYIKARYNPITFRMLIDTLDGKAPLPERPLIVTFDDGYNDNYHNAFPILKSLGIPATIFLSTGYIGSPKPFWFELVAHIVYRAPNGLMALDDLQLTLRLDDDVASRRTATYQLLRKLKQVRNKQRLSFLEQFEHDYASVVDTASFPLSQPMTWDQIREMHTAGIEFGSHTITHPILSQLDDKALEYELAGSKQQIEQELDDPILVLAYPVGDTTAFDERVMRAAQNSGYRLGVSYIKGVNRLDKLDHFTLYRQHVESYTSKYFFTGLLSLPEIFQ